MLKEALSNLVDNAIRYSPGAGIVTVRCGGDQGCPFVEVQDKGPGIAEEHRQRVLECFYRIPGTSGEDCGLGLPIVCEIAQLHGAEIQLQGVMPAGLRVRVSFPER
jgi:two-component system sensor histidine kinase TctE